MKKFRCQINFLYYHLKKIIFIMRYVSVLGLVLKARVFGSWLRPSKGLLTAGVSGLSRVKTGKREAKISSPMALEKPDTQTSLLKNQCICHILPLSIFSIMER